MEHRVPAKEGCNRALLATAISPRRSKRQYIGKQSSWHDNVGTEAGNVSSCLERCLKILLVGRQLVVVYEIDIVIEFWYAELIE